jgi:hypothetical protein
MNKRLAASIGVVGALLTSSIALAASSEPNSLLTEGYDADNHKLVWGVADHPEAEGTTATLDCQIQGTFTYTVDDAGQVVTLVGEDGLPAAYQPVDETADPVPYDPTGEECVLTVTDVEGPNGQVNHGTIVSSFVHALKEAGIRGVGCYVRFIAGSSYGKGEQQVQAGEVIPPTEPVTEGEVTLATHETKCGNQHADGDEELTSAGNGNGNGNGNGRGKPQGAGQGRPPWAGQGGGRP